MTLELTEQQFSLYGKQQRNMNENLEQNIMLSKNRVCCRLL